MLPAGSYTIRAFTPQPVAGRSYMWAVPVAIRPSMTEVVQLTNGNASVDSTVERDRAVAAPASSMPAAPVVEGPPASPSYVPPRALDSSPLRANTSRFFLGLAFNGSSIRFDDADEIESGGGISAQIGWGFTKNFALLFDLSGAAISTDVGDVGLGHAELGARWHFANEARALVPFLEVGFAGRAVVQDDMLYYDDFGNPYSGDFSLSGTGVSFGGGLQYHVTPTMALGASLKWSVGDFTTVTLDDVSVDGLDMGATTARLNLGFTWYPVAGSLR
jgi:opacity protein-like surface antigen